LLAGTQGDAKTFLLLGNPQADVFSNGLDTQIRGRHRDLLYRASATAALAAISSHNRDDRPKAGETTQDDRSTLSAWTATNHARLFFLNDSWLGPETLQALIQPRGFVGQTEAAVNRQQSVVAFQRVEADALVQFSQADRAGVQRTRITFRQIVAARHDVAWRLLQVDSL
jgi:hypothetical protein